MSRWILLTVAMFALSLAASLGLWTIGFDRLPAQVPTHWGMDGQPDAFTPRERMLPHLLLMPGFLAFWILLTLALPWLSPRNYEVADFKSTYHFIMALTATMMGYLHLVILGSYLGMIADIGRWIVAGLAGFFIALGLLLAQVKPNFWIGVRTPWTLASPVVWERTHQFAGRLFVGAGVLSLVVAIAGFSMAYAIALILAAAIVPIMYSLIVYKRLDRAGKLETGPAAPTPPDS